jgi:hypothetical protein
VAFRDARANWHRSGPPEMHRPGWPVLFSVVAIWDQELLLVVS